MWPGMDQLPFSNHNPQHALGGLDVEIDLAQTPDGRAHGNTIPITSLGRSQFFLLAIDIIDDGKMLGAVLFL